MAAGSSSPIIKKAITNYSIFLHNNNVSLVCFSSSPTHSEGYHASDERKRKPDYDKGFNDDRTVADAGDRILEMTEKTKRSMEESMAKTAKKIEASKKKSETSTADTMKNIWGKAKERTQKIKESVVAKLWYDDKKSIEDYIEDHTGRKKKENDDKKH